MVIWHETQDAQRVPSDVTNGDKVIMWIGSYPVEHGQAIIVELNVSNGAEETRKYSIEAEWKYNDYTRNNSYWAAIVGPFENGQKVEYRIVGTGSDRVEHIQVGSFEVRTRR